MMPLRGGLAPLTLVTNTATGNGLLNNLVAYWALDEAGGANNALDKHTNGLTLTQSNSPGSTTGKVYAGVRTFNGSNQHFTRASETLLQAGDFDWTVAAWAYMTSVPANGSGLFPAIVAKDGTNKREFAMLFHSAAQVFRLTVLDGTATVIGTASATTFGAPSPGTWYLVTASHDAANNSISISVNAGTADSAATTGTAGTNTGVWEVGRYLDDGNAIRQWNGRIGPLMYWKSTAGNGGVLTAAQRTALYAAGSGLAYSAFTL